MSTFPQAAPSSLSFNLITKISGLSLCSAVIKGSSTFHTSDLPNWLLTTAMPPWAVSSAVSDIIITICMTALLLHAKRNSDFGVTRDLLSRLIRLIWQTGLVTAVLALLVVPLYFGGVFGTELIPIYLLGKSYVISLLANLNARRKSNALTVHGNDDQGSQATQVSTLVYSPPNHRSEGRDIDFTDVSEPVHFPGETYNQCRRPTNPGVNITEKQGAMNSSI